MKILKDKRFWIVVVITVIIVVIVIYYAKKKNGSSTAASTKTTSSAATSTSVFPLKYDSRGEEVKNVQRYINNNYLSKQTAIPQLVVDGIWGQKTDSAVKSKLNLSQIDSTYYNQVILKK